MDQSDVSIRKLSISKCKHIHELFNFTTKNDKNIDSSKEGSDCDYAAFSSQENRQFNLNIKPRSLGFCRGSSVEGRKSSVEGQMSRGRE